MAYVKRLDVGQAFRKNTELLQFILTDMTPTGRILGTGSFGSVEEVSNNLPHPTVLLVEGKEKWSGSSATEDLSHVMYKRLTCAGKRMHEILFQAENEGVPEMVSKYLQECQLMSSLRHPNITQFLGLCFLPGSQLPLLVMERLETSLDSLLENTPNLPLSVKCSILENVASGLLFLHERNPPVIHRDLTSKNVLLTSFLVAKITDMGNSRIVRPGQVARTLSALPGTLVYMPPEAQDDTHRYGPPLDVFSFGHLALFTFIQTFPGELLPSTFPNPDNIREVRGRTELERRGKYIEMLEAEFGQLHLPLVQLIKECLHNVPNERPTTSDLYDRLQRMREEVERGSGGSVKLDMTRLRLAKEAQIKDRRIEELTQQQEAGEAELQCKSRQLEGTTRELEMKMADIRSLQGEIQVQNEKLVQKNQEIASKDQELVEQRGKIQQLQEEVHQREACLRGELQSQETEISRLREELKKCQELMQDGVLQKQIPFKVPLQLKWRCGPSMPFGMRGTIQSVQVQGTVYFGGGGAFVDQGDYVVMAYNIDSATWATLPPYSTRWFAMAAIDNYLVLVGGRGRDGLSKVLSTWREDGKKWTNSYQDMTTPRSKCSAVSYKPWLVVAGGSGDGGKTLSSVEVMNTDTKQWYSGPPTPIAWESMKIAVMGDECYFMGGGIEGVYSNRVFSASLPALFPLLNSDSSTTDTQTWKELSQLPVKRAAPLSIGESLLAVGGKDKDRKAVSVLHLYKPDAGQWVKVADLTSRRCNCTCTKINETELLVAGGEYDREYYLKSMDIAQVMSSQASGL